MKIVMLVRDPKKNGKKQKRIFGRKERRREREIITHNPSLSWLARSPKMT